MTNAKAHDVSERAAVADRRARALAMRSGGNTYQQIADALGYGTRQQAANDCDRALKASVKEMSVQAETLRALELEHLDELRRVCMRVLERIHPLVSAGKVVSDQEVMLLDDGPALAAIDRLIKISQRRSRLLGIDAPAELHVTAGPSVMYVNDVIVSDGDAIESDEDSDDERETD